MGRRVVSVSVVLVTAALHATWAQQATQGALSVELHRIGSREFSTESTVAMVGFFLPPQERPGGQAAVRTPGALAALRSPSSDAKLYLAAAQIDGILPFVRDLAANPYPSPAKARSIQSGIEGILSRDQKKAWDDFVEEIARLRERGANALQNLTPEQRQRLQQGAADRGQLSPEERLERAATELIRRLESRRKELGA